MVSIDIPGRLWQKGAMEVDPDTEGAPARQDAILDAALGAFAAYGYRRTTMEDIARAASMSRSALYLHFRNKDDIFRSLTRRYLDQALTDMETALHRPGQTAEEALYAAFVAKDGQLMEVVLTTPHGAELMDAGFQASPGLVAEASARTAGVLADWLVSRGLPPGLGPAPDLAQTIVAALMGVKSSAQSLPDLRAKEAQLARLIGRAL